MCCCCNDHDPAAPDGTVQSDSASEALELGAVPWRRRMTSLVQWAIPIVTLALVPKCPVCMAAYVLLFTGVGLSLAVATTIRWLLIAMSIAALAYLLLRSMRRVFGFFNKSIHAEAVNSHVL